MEDVNVFRRGIVHVALLTAVLTGAACAPPPPPHPDLPRLAVSTQITSRNMCSLGVSPAVSIANAPPATARYRIGMTNLDVLFQDPWRTTVPAKPDGYAEGAIPDYEGPCVGDLRLYASYPYYTYRFEVMALDAQDRSLAYGETLVRVQAIAAAVEQERAARGGQSHPPTMPPQDQPPMNPLTNPMLFPSIPGPVYEP